MDAGAGSEDRVRLTIVKLCAPIAHLASPMEREMRSSEFPIRDDEQGNARNVQKTGHCVRRRPDCVLLTGAPNFGEGVVTKRLDSMTRGRFSWTGI